MDHRHIQKLEEQQIAEAYLKKRGITGQLDMGPEPPDLILCTNGRSIGIEVTTYHAQDQTQSGYTRRQVEATWEKIRDYVAVLDYQPSSEFHGNWLIIAGGAYISEITDVWFLFLILDFEESNKSLSNGPYDEVAIFCASSFLWRRNRGWSEI